MLQRHITPRLLAALSDTPVVLLHGARQTGKSTLVRNLDRTAHPARYLTLDDATVLSSAAGDPQGFVDGLEGPVILDEVQRAPELFLAIKRAVDRDRRPGRFLLTGSANVLLLPRLAESLVGRLEILTLWPLSQGEIHGRREGVIDALFSGEEPEWREAEGDFAAVWNEVLLGGYPEVRTRDLAERRREWFGAYLTTILQRDVRDLSRIEGLTEVPRLLSLLASRLGNASNFAELSRESGLPQTTLKRYLTLLETTFLVQRLPAWSGNPEKRLTRAAKLLLTDPGLAAHLMGVEGERDTARQEDRGRLLECFVFAELRKAISWSRTRPRLFHYRTRSGGEVDFMLEDAAGRCVGIEVKAGASAGGRDFRGLRELGETLGERFLYGLLLYAGREPVPFGKKLHAVPLENLWTVAAEHVSGLEDGMEAEETP
ncbi:MAG TPA: ATP-binding protein [Thermoanaerobaculia bacterium]|nr:ATP-binding protein [Thermoanaerobaculia bacterium]